LICVIAHSELEGLIFQNAARFGAFRAKEHPMRTITQPPPSSRCELCGGELRLMQVESANRALDLESEILVCVKCGHEQAYIVSHNHTVCHMSDPKAA
jgi:hypothetical protein